MYMNAKLIYRKAVCGKNCYLCHAENKELIVYDLKRDDAIFHICEKCVALVGPDIIESSLAEAMFLVRAEKRRKENSDVRS